MSSSAAQRIVTGYDPRPIQDRLHMSVRRFNVVVCHRRFGKTVWAINHMIAKGLRNEKTHPQYAYLAPLYAQAKRVAWNYLKRYTENLPGVSVNEAELRVDIPRPGKGDFVRIMLLGAENPASLKGIYLDGAILDEYAEMNPSAWREAIYPTLLDRQGWAIFIGTPKGRNAFWKLYNYATSGQDSEWFAALYKASETGLLSHAELERARATMTPEEYEQEFECSFQAGMTGAYFSRELDQVEREGRICKVPYDPSLRVDTYWDLGMNDVAAIWFIQSHRFEHRAIRYLEAPDTSIPEWIKQARAFGYHLGDFYLPHDVKVREMSSGKSRIESFTKLGIRPRVIPRVDDKLDSINAARLILSKCWFDQDQTARGLEALRNYQRRWDEKSQVFSPKPLHNWASNGADAFQQFAMGVKEERGVSPVADQLMTITEYDPFY